MHFELNFFLLKRFGTGDTIFSSEKLESNFGNGAPTRTRTADLLITNQLLYQLSYKGTARALAYSDCAFKRS